MPYINGSWVNWTSYFVNPSNSTNPIAAVTTTINNALPWFWPIIPFVLYIYLMILYDESPTRYRIAAITGLVLVVSIVMAASGLIADAVLNTVLFGAAYMATFLFKL